MMGITAAPAQPPSPSSPSIARMDAPTGEGAPARPVEKLTGPHAMTAVLPR
jgi:hypothetical protein